MGDHGWIGLGIGLGVGVAFGYLVGGSLSGDDPSKCGVFFDEDPSLCLSSEDKAVFGAIFGGLIGVVVGRIIGERKEKDRWESVSFHVVRPSIQVAPSRRVKVGFAIPFKP